MTIVGAPSTVVSESQGFSTEVALDLGGCHLPSSNHQTRASENEPSRLSENLKPETSNRDFLSRGLGAIAAVLLTVGGLFTARDLATSQPQQLVAAVEAPAKAETPRYLSKPIAEIQPIIDRVLADNPETDGQAPSDFGTVDAANWRLLKLVIPKPDGEWLKVTLARPATWLETQERDDSGRLWLEFEELDIANWADVLSVESCPEPAIGDGRLVTGKFEHSSADVIDLHVAAQTQPIGTTSNHPFWSEDRQDFVQAGDLQIGERLRLESGSLTTVIASVPRQGQVPVFNLEVDGEHVYYVGDVGVLVHNNYPKPIIRGPYDFYPGSGQWAHGQFSDWLKKTFGLKITGSNIREGLTGIDLKLAKPLRGLTDVYGNKASAFRYIELKPLSASGRATFLEQLRRWRSNGGLGPNPRSNVGLFTYYFDANGNPIFEFWGTSN